MKESLSIQAYTKEGPFTAQQLRQIAEVSERYGNGTARLMSARAVALPGVPEEQRAAVVQGLAAADLLCAMPEQSLRPVNFCRGLNCRHGQIDTQGLAAKIEERFLTAYKDAALPHKFRIAVCGCPNNCAKVDLCDIGIMGWQHGYKVYLGGMWGKKRRAGTASRDILHTEEDVLDLVGRALSLYQTEGRQRERFGDMLERLALADQSDILAYAAAKEAD